MGNPENEAQKIGQNQGKQAELREHSQGETTDWSMGTRDTRSQMPTPLRITYNTFASFLKI